VTGLKCPSNRADGPRPMGDSCQKLATEGSASAVLFPASAPPMLNLCTHSDEEAKSRAMSDLMRFSRFTVAAGLFHTLAGRGVGQRTVS
jgi:hypothetical protein